MTLRYSIVTLALSRTVSEIKWRYLQKFPNQSIFNAPRGFYLEFCNDVGALKTRVMPLPDGQKKCDDMSTCLDTVPALDGQKW